MIKTFITSRLRMLAYYDIVGFGSVKYSSGSGQKVVRICQKVVRICQKVVRTCQKVVRICQKVFIRQKVVRICQKVFIRQNSGSTIMDLLYI